VLGGFSWLTPRAYGRLLNLQGGTYRGFFIASTALVRHDLPGKASRFWKKLLVPGITSESPNMGESEFLHHRSKNKYKVI
jgi:hypothetical protein